MAVDNSVKLGYVAIVLGGGLSVVLFLLLSIVWVSSGVLDVFESMFFDRLHVGLRMIPNSRQPTSVCDRWQLTFVRLAIMIKRREPVALYHLRRNSSEKLQDLNIVARVGTLEQRWINIGDGMDPPQVVDDIVNW